MAEIRPRIVVHEAERDHDAQVMPVGFLDCVLQGVVEVEALGLLHPVQDVAAFHGGTGIERGDAFSVDHGGPHDGSDRAMALASSSMMERSAGVAMGTPTKNLCSTTWNPQNLKTAPSMVCLMLSSMFDFR